jgi:hypothetical protein
MGEESLKLERDWVERFEIVSRFLLTAAACIVAWMSFLFQRVDQQRAVTARVQGEEQQIRANRTSSEAARRVFQVQTAGGLAQIVVSGNLKQRQEALLMLKQVAPSLAVDLSAILRETATSEQERSFADQVNADASAREIVALFQQHLGLARELSGRGLYQAACSEYLLAWNGLPEVLGGNVSVEKIDSGLTACSLQPADYRKGVKDLQEAFRNIQFWQE